MSFFSEAEVIDVLVWVLVVGMIMQSIIHFTTYTIIVRQHDRTRVGKALKHQMFWLGMKNTLLTGFHTILALLVTTGVYYLTPNQRVSLYVAIIITITLTVGTGLILVLELKREDWGLRREADRVLVTARQQAATDVQQTARGDEQDKRQVSQDSRDERIDERETGFILRDESQNLRGDRLTDRADELDERGRGVRLEDREVTE